MRDETAVEVGEAEEALEIFDRLRLGVMEDGIHVGGEGGNA